jgi:mitochondrial fission protein ELM1
MAEPTIWALLGQRLGDNNQVLALAEALDLPFEVKELRYNHWRHLRPRLLGASTLSLTNESREKLGGDPPGLVISTGLRSVPVVQWLRRQSRGRTIAVHVGYPRISPAEFDLVVATPEYPIADHPNLKRIPFALTRRSPDRQDEPIDPAYPARRRLLILGGPTLYWSLAEARVTDAVTTLLAAADRDGGSLLVVGSPRTPVHLLDAVRNQLARARVPALLVPVGGPPSYRALLRGADEIFVTADSVAMISDAIATGKPVGILPIEQSALGRAYLGFMDRVRPGQRAHPRDLRFFWRTLEQDQLTGTLEQPGRGAAPDLPAEIAGRVLSLLRDRGNFRM